MHAVTLFLIKGCFMATTKAKSTKTAKPTTKTVKKAPAKKKTTTRATSTKKAQPQYRSLHVSSPDRPFLSFNVTRQTFYWLIILALVLGLGGWVISLQIKINDLYNKIEENQQSISTYQTMELAAKKKAATLKSQQP